MSVALQVRGVPEEVRDALASAATARGQSLQAYLLDIVTREAAFQHNRQLLDSTFGFRIELDGSAPPPEDLVREGRDDGFELDRTS